MSVYMSKELHGRLKQAATAANSTLNAYILQRIMMSEVLLKDGRRIPVTQPVIIYGDWALAPKEAQDPKPD